MTPGLSGGETTIRRLEELLLEIPLIVKVRIDQTGFQKKVECPNISTFNLAYETPSYLYRFRK
jgi:hypothetical protein